MKLKFWPALLLWLSGAMPLSGTAQSYSWAQSFTAAGVSGATAAIGKMAFDVNNNSYFIGSVNGTLDIDQGPGVFNITSVGQNALFVLKEDASGNFLWAKAFQCKSASNIGFLGPASISLDISGNIYVAGRFSDTVDFDPGVGTYYLTARYGNTSLYNGFVVKLNPSGDFLWAKRIGGDSISAAWFNDMSVTENGVYLIGGAVGAVDVDPGLSQFMLPNGGSILEKLDTAGNFNWVKVMGGIGFKITNDNNANFYIVGGAPQIQSDFDPGPGTAYLTNFGGDDIFIQKFDSSGNHIWVKGIGGTQSDIGFGISVDPFGSVAVTGKFEASVDFDPGPGVFNMTSNSTRSAFTLKLNNNGDFKWAKMAGASVGLFEARAIASDSVGSVYTALYLPNSCDINPGTGTFTVPAGVAVQKLDSSGNFVWGAGWQGDIPGWIGLDHNNSVYTTGTFSGSNKDFDPGPGTYFLSGSGQGSGFIHKMCQNSGNVNLTTSANTACTGDSVIITASWIAGAKYKWYRNGTLLTDTTNSIKVTTSGTYIVESGTGCAGYDTTVVSFFPVGNPVISLAPTAVATVGQIVNNFATLSNAGTGYNIDWYRNGVLFSTTTTNNVSYTKTAGTDTIVAVIYKQGNTCYKPDTSNERMVAEVNSVEDIIASNGIAIYPNPSSGLFTFSARIAIEKIEITDLTGKVVLTSVPNANSFTIDLKGKAAGVYFYSITIGERKMRGKIVLE